MKKLQILNISYSDGVNEDEIKDLNLIKLIATNNPKIKQSTIDKIYKK